MNFTSVPSTQIQDTMARLSDFEGWDKEPLARLATGAKPFFLPRKEKLVAKGEPTLALLAYLA